MKFTTLVISLSAIFAQASSSFTTNDATTDTAAVVSEHQLQTKLLLDNISTNVHPDPIKRALTPKYAKNKKSRSKTNVPVPPVVPVPPLVPDILTVRKFEGTYVYPGCGGGFYRANIDCDFYNDLCVYEEFRVGTVYDAKLVGEDILDDSFISVGDPDSPNYYIKPSTVEDPELICTFFGTFSASTAGKERTNELKPIALSVSDACNDVSKAKQYVVKVGSLFDRVYLSFSQDGGEIYYTQDHPRSTTKVDTEGEERRKLILGGILNLVHKVTNAVKATIDAVSEIFCPEEQSADSPTTDSPTKAPMVGINWPTKAPTYSEYRPWAVTYGTQCGGDTISYLEDGTPDGYNPESPTYNVGICKAICGADPDCTAFEIRNWSYDCHWKKDVSTATMTEASWDCHYLHRDLVSIAPTISPKPTFSPTPGSTPEPTPKPTSTPTPKPTITPTSSPKPTPEPTPKPTPEPTISQAPSDSPTKAPTDSPTQAPTYETVSKITWAVTNGYQCGGSTISSLEDGTPYGWKPRNPGYNINKCKTKCVDSPSCNAFIWGPIDSSCRWKSGVSADTMHQDRRNDCYSLREEVVSTMWTVDNSYCGGTIIPKLEDGTANSWNPNTEGYDLNMCKSKCVSSPSCVAFEWNGTYCYWHRSISGIHSPGVGYCYSYEKNPGCEPLSTLTQNNFNDKGKTALAANHVISYTLANGYPVQLTGWSHTRTYAKGYLRTKGKNWSKLPMAVVSGLVPGGIYTFKVYQYASLHAGTNPLSVNGISWGETTSSTSMEATAKGEATADGQGKITFTFTAQSAHVQLSGLAIGRCQAPPTNAPTPGPTAGPTNGGCEHLSSLAENNFNDQGKTNHIIDSTFSYTLANGYPVQLKWWSHTRDYAYSFLRNKDSSPTSGSPTAVVSGLVPGGSYAFKVYQYASKYAGTNSLSVNGISWGETTQSASMEATAEGEATADGQGEITFTFTRQSAHVHLSGLAIGAIGSCTKEPTAVPTNAPTDSPTNAPTAVPTNAPTNAPTDEPTHAPTNTPTNAPTNAPTATPTFAPTTLSPTQNPTKNPTGVPTTHPSESPSGSFFPSLAPTTPPTKSPAPSASPTAVLSASPTKVPTNVPTNAPTTGPTTAPTPGPTAGPTNAPTNGPTHVPTNVPTTTPTNAPTVVPTHVPTNAPTNAPLDGPTASPVKLIENGSKPTVDDVLFPPIGPTECPPDILLLKHDGVTTYPENSIRILSQDETTVTVELVQLFTTPTSTIDYIFYQYNVNVFTNLCYEEDHVFGGASIAEITIECTRTSQVAFLELWFADDGSKGVFDEQGDTALIPNCCYPDAVPQGTPVTKYNFKINCISKCQGGEIE